MPLVDPARDQVVKGLYDALKGVLRTGLNGGNNMRLAYIAAGGKALTPELLTKAEESEQAVIAARTAIALYSQVIGDEGVNPSE